ncbi:pre-rRNA-processing protein TSR2 homolog [Pleurodeles waltl]|uniref:pre-rRNA-processing protein TSR2 homolog n=1 Tax=Pleurodeles waltl TaxID=8319 RepID=UPI00370952D8
MAASSDSRGLLQEGIRAALENWAVLQIAVDNGFGGAYSQEKAEWMVGAVAEYFHSNADLEQYEVEEFLSELMNTEFDTLVEDGSLPEVAQQLCTFSRQCQRGEVAAMQERLAQLCQRKKHVKVSAVQGRAPGQEEDDSEEEEDDEEEEAMDCEEPPSLVRVSSPEAASPGSHETTPKVDSTETDFQEEAAADGWTVVRRKKK